jgi:hypothetical protein
MASKSVLSEFYIYVYIIIELSNYYYMKYLKKYIKFFEDGSGSGDAYATANASGMGGVISAQPGNLPGTFGTDGSGDIGFTFKKRKRKKGDPSEVSDLRDLEYVETSKVKDIKESVSFENFTEEEKDAINDSIIDLLDSGFNLNLIEKNIRDEEVEINDEEYSIFKQQTIQISLEKNLNEIWDGNLLIRQTFDKEEFLDKRVSTLRPRGPGLSRLEEDLFKEVKDISHRLINLLDYEDGYFNIGYVSYKRVNTIFKKVDVSIILYKNILNGVSKTYESSQDVILDLSNYLKSKKFSPVQINKIIDSYSDMIYELSERGENTSLILKRIIGLLPETIDDNFLQVKLPSSSWRNTTYL